jgi:hypothetical protein
MGRFKELSDNLDLEFGQTIDDNFKKTDDDLTSHSARMTKIEQDSINRDNAKENESIQRDNALDSTIKLKEIESKQRDDALTLRINNIVSYSGSSNQEIVDTHMGVDGKVYPVLNDRLNKMELQQVDGNRQTQTFTHGTQILNATQNSPVDFEIQGRTLTSLAMSNLLPTTYVLADKKFKIRYEGREGTLLSGVGKFTKSGSLVTKADFSGKVGGSVTENPHVAKSAYGGITILANPSTVAAWAEFGVGYPSLPILNGAPYSTTMRTSNGEIAQHLFSFNVIEQIERKMGRIPADTVAGKVQWIKDNVNKLLINWHGFGSSVNGNGANLVLWKADTSAWTATVVNHTTNTVQKLFYQAQLNYITTDGFIHALAYADASNGTVASTINTDFVELEIELKSTAVLDTRPIITRVANFEGKISGSVVENPHAVKHAYNNSLISPSTGGWVEHTQVYIDRIKSLDSNSYSPSTTTSGQYAQHLFSFDLIAEVERNIGRIPKATVAEKVQWLKDNVEKVAFEWYGFGSSVGGNKASIRMWSVSSNGWLFTATHSNPSVTILTIGGSATSPVNYRVMDIIDVNGLGHFISFAEPSDGTTASTINTDYASLDINLKQGATLHDPSVPLYEVDAADYAKILVDWNETEVLNRFPKVQGIQHLQNLAVISEGENLLPPFNEWSLHANTKVFGPYELELNATTTGQTSSVSVPVIPGQQYTFSCTKTNGGQHYVEWLDSNKNTIGNTGATIVQSYTVTVPAGVAYLKYMLRGNGAGTFTFTNPILTLGSTAKPFVPRNPSYLYAPVKLGQIGSVKDSLFRQDGQWQLVERVKKDVVLDGTHPWLYNGDKNGFKWFYISANVMPITSKILVVTDFKGNRLTDNANGLYDNGTYVTTAGSLTITIPDIDTGLGETYSPITTEIQAYFNGWQAKTVDANGKPTAWRSLGDGTDAPTQTLAYVSTTKAPNFTPYKLSYVLATPQTQNVNHLVEGDIAISGPTQVEVTSGVIVREKVVPYLTGGTHILNLKSNVTSYFKNVPLRIIKVYKNGAVDSRWLTGYNSSYVNNVQLYQPQVNPDDSTAEYTVTYLVLDRHLQTVNALDVKCNYAGNIKDSLDMQVEKVADLAAQQSILANQMYRVLVAAKGAGWNV